MSVVAFASGTVTPTVGQEVYLANPNFSGTYTFHIDLSNMASGDTVELRIYSTILSGGTPKCTYYQSFSDAPSSNNIVQISVPVSNDLNDANSLRFSVKQTAGTSRSFAWKVLKYG